MLIVASILVKLKLELFTPHLIVMIMMICFCRMIDRRKALCEKCPNTEFFSGPDAGKYRPEKSVFWHFARSEVLNEKYEKGLQVLFTWSYNLIHISRQIILR